MLVDRLSSPMTLVWLVYFSFAELLSLLPSSQASSCILISEEASAENYSRDYACASMHEAIFRFVKFIWSESGHDNVVAFGTILIATFTYVLYRSTEKLWLAGEGQIAVALKAANAADRSARAAISLRLPIIRVEPDNLGHGEFASGQKISEDCHVHSIGVSNLGATKAFPTEVIYGWTVGETLPEEPKYQVADRFPHNCILEPGQIPFIQTLNGSLPLKEGQWTRICGGNYLWFYCEIIYEDFMGEIRTHGFCWRWSNTGMGLDWRVERREAYNKKT
jgi:hypothetical protein